MRYEKSTDPGCSPTFSRWAFEHTRYKWVAYTLVYSTIISLGIWWFFMFVNRIYYILPYGELAYTITTAISFTLNILLIIAIGYVLVRLHTPK